ncbi:hypothetical protein Vqi01_42230 [Micromonospora qiuiae]|uniref:Uncharacterized protein n=1 Tax=Micromonospora qiuiae TaxID=502268 RepID=A0ABQ4JFS3_9ACTN|nr:hypothetical protein Vqi01_42230 [Micromonospora qiuiae]
MLPGRQRHDGERRVAPDGPDRIRGVRGRSGPPGAVGAGVVLAAPHQRAGGRAAPGTTATTRAGLSSGTHDE